MNNIYIRCKRRKLYGTLDLLLFGNYILRNFNLKNFSRLLLNYASGIENQMAWHVESYRNFLFKKKIVDSCFKM